MPKGHRLSMAEIARRAGVQRPAVHNWRRRHADFPAPVPTFGGEVYDAEEIAVWLDGRRIPRNALKAGEAVGTTFGERFRRAFSAVDREGGDADAQEERQKGLDSAADIASLDHRIWRLVDRARDVADISDYGDRLLELLYIRCAEPGHWADLVAALSSPTITVTRRLAGALRASGVRPVDGAQPGARTSPDPRQEALLRDLVELIGRELDIGDAGGGAGSAGLAAALYRRLLGRLMAAEGRRGGEYHTPDSVVDTIAAMLEPKRDEYLCDPCCGTGELLVAAATRDPGRRNAPVRGLALGARACRLATMNLAVHGVPARVNDSALDALRRPQDARRYHVVVANPPFNISGWTSKVESDDPRWRYGVPSVHNANFAWIQHVVSLLVEGGRAAVVMPNNATFSAKRAERAIRAAMVEDGLVECVVALPAGLFPTTGIPVTLWLLRTARSADRGVLLLDASGLGEVRRAGRVLSADDVREIAQVYRQWLARRTGEPFDVAPHLAKHAEVAEIRDADYDLNPRRYVVHQASFDRGRLTDDVRRLRTDLADLQDRAAALDLRMARLLGGLTPWTA